MDVIQVLKKDHKRVHKLFKEFEDLSGNRGAQKKPALVNDIRQALSVHAQIEEELVYPFFQEHRTLKDLICEAKEEHHVAKQLLSELEQLQPGDEQYDAKVKVLCEYTMHHVKEEEKELLPQAQKRFSSKRLEALGEEVESRRSQLMGEDEHMEMQEPMDEELEAMDDDALADDAEGKSHHGRRHAA